MSLLAKSSVSRLDSSSKDWRICIAPSDPIELPEALKCFSFGFPEIKDAIAVALSGERELLDISISVKQILLQAEIDETKDSMWMSASPQSLIDNN